MAETGLKGASFLLLIPSDNLITEWGNSVEFQHGVWHT